MNSIDAAESMEVLTTTQVATLTGRSVSAVKGALNVGYLDGVRVDGFWRVRKEDAVAWHAKSRHRPFKRRSSQYERAAQMLSDYGSASAFEMARLLGLHEGNARKYLAILAAEGRAVRDSDGQWHLISQDHQEVSA